MEATEPEILEQPKSSKLKNWLHAALVAISVLAVAVVHFITAGSGQGYLFGSQYTTIAGAFAFSVIMYVVSERVMAIRHSLPRKKAEGVVALGVAAAFVGATPLYLTAYSLYAETKVMDAYMDGYNGIAHAGQLIEKHPENARKIGYFFGAELVAKNLSRGWSAEQTTEYYKELDEHWKSIGFDETPAKRPEWVAAEE
jgi:hypothetical protein